MNKKGDFGSIIILAIFMITTGILVFISALFFMNVIPELQGMEEIEANANATEGIAIIYSLLGIFDWAMLFLFVGAIGGLIISSYYIDSFPGMTFIFIILLIIGVFLSMQLANVFYEISNDVEFIAVSAEFPITNFILGQAFPLFILVAGVITAIVLYGKGRSGGNIGGVGI